MFTLYLLQENVPVSAAVRGPDLALFGGDESSSTSSSSTDGVLLPLSFLFTALSGFRELLELELLDGILS
jgi:hypothetical protein